MTDRTVTFRVPRNEKIEQALLSELLTDNAKVERVGNDLRPEHFYDPLHQRIFAAIVELVGRGDEAGAHTLFGLLRADPEADGTPGGVDAYIAALAANCNYGDVRSYVRTILDHHQRRTMIEMGMRLVSDAGDVSLRRSAADVLAEHEGALLALDDASTEVKPLVPVRVAVQQAITAADDAARSGNAISGVTTGLRDLDWRTGGLQPGELIVLGARPSMGKSDLGWNIAINAGRVKLAGGHGGASSLVFSQEMPPRQLGARLLAREVGVTTDRQRRGDVTGAEFAAFAHAVPDLPVWIDGTSRITPAYILRRAKRLRRQHGLDLIVIDHLNIMGAPEGLRSQGDTAIVTEITRELKAVATSLDVPVLLLCQLSRQVEMREDKRPQLSDLRQSGSIEQDADSVWFLYREDYYLHRSEPVRREGESGEAFSARMAHWDQRMAASQNLADVIVAKQRMGPVGTVRLHYDGARSSFSDLDQTSWEG